MIECEHDAVAHFAKALYREFPQAHFQRLEDSFSAGIPDAVLTVGAGDFWVEFKYVKQLPVRSATPVKVGLRKEQNAWLTRRGRAGSRVAVVTCVEGREWLAHREHFTRLFAGVPYDQLAALAFWRCQDLLGEKLSVQKLLNTWVKDDL